MIIIVQDKSLIVNFNNVKEIFLNKNEPRILASLTLDVSSLINLGIYKNHERASEVLQEIINSYQKTQFYKYGAVGDKSYIVETLDDVFVYKMPEK